MADHRLSEVRFDGERLIFGGGRLHTEEEDGRIESWEIMLEGAHVLHRERDERVRLHLATEEGRTFEGVGRVTDPGYHGETTETYDGLTLAGTGPLEDR